MLYLGEGPYSQEIYIEVVSGEVSECQQLPFKRQSKYIYTSISVCGKILTVAKSIMIVT